MSRSKQQLEQKDLEPHFNQGTLMMLAGKSLPCFDVTVMCDLQRQRKKVTTIKPSLVSLIPHPNSSKTKENS